VLDDAPQPLLSELLQARRAVVAEHWYTAIARTGFAPRPAADVRAKLAAATDQAIGALLAEQFDRPQARAIGAALADLHYIHPDALGGTLDALGQGLVADLPAERLSALHPRLTALLAEVASGFYARSRSMILDEQDQIRRALFVSRRQAEAAEDARIDAETAVGVRTDVLNAAAHDLRTPVTTILGHADLLLVRLERELPPTPEWLRARREAIRKGATRIRAMVDELLDAARLQTGQSLELQLETVDVGALVRDIARPRDPGVSGGPQIVVDAPTGLIVEGDRARLERVVDNLLGNAIKYSPAATPIHVEARGEQEGVTVTVRDQGVGIPADELPRLFTPFYRAATARGIPGVGIGLAGAKTIVEQHGGRITVDSAAGQGTTVVITLPYAPPAPPTPDSLTEPTD